MWYHLTLVRMSIIKKPTNNKCWRGYAEKEFFLHCCSVQFSRWVVSDSLQPHEPQHTRPPCPSPTSRVYPNPYPLSWWCHPTILSSVIPFSSWTQSFPASGSFQISQLFASGGQSIRVSASTLTSKFFIFELQLQISPSNEHPGLISFRMDWLDFLAVRGILKSFLQHHS